MDSNLKFGTLHTKWRHVQVDECSKSMSNLYRYRKHAARCYCERIEFESPIKMSEDKKKALFICLGNICRSPIAEAVFIDEVRKAGVANRWEIDSAAIGSWHVGRNPDSRALNTMKQHNLAYNNKARQIKTPDFKKYDYIFGMDDDNMYELNRMAPKDGTAKLLLLGDFDPQGIKEIRDPYYDSNSQGFEDCYVQAVRCCKEFLKQFGESKV